MLFRRRSPWDTFTYWALDLETGGLDRRKDPILAVGMVPIRGGTVRLGEAYRTLVRPANGRIDPESVRAHQLLWEEVQGAPPLEAVLPEVDRRIGTGILLVHHEAIDVAFLKRDFRAVGLPQSGELPAPPAVCTWPAPPATVPGFGRRQSAPAADASDEYLQNLRSLGYV